MMKIDISSSQLISLQQEKVEALWEFVAVSETLYQCFLNRDFGEIARQLEKRENLIHSIDEIDRRILQASPETTQGGATETPGGDEDPVLHNLRTLLREAAELNERCLTRAALLRDELKNELGKASEGGAAARRYFQQADSAPRFMDVRR